MSTTDAIREEARKRLAAVEQDFGVRVLYACESGSRAWGFASEDSDFDVRFLFLRPASAYLSIDDPRDVIEQPMDGPWDVNGWDLRKALRLLRKSNPPLLEWLSSPIVYRETTSIPERLRALIPSCCSLRACAHHYLHMARGNFREFLQGDEVWVKKYLYVLRPLLAIRWIEQEGTAAPMELRALVEGTISDAALLRDIDDLLRRKRAGAELDRGPRIPGISAFIDSELRRHVPGAFPGRTEEPDTAPLNALFREALEEVWGVRIAGL